MSTAAGAAPVFASTRPLVFAHRGGAGLTPENTLPAFLRGLAEGADGLELDVRLSADGVPMVIHDPTLDRTTDGTGPVAARTAAELACLDAGFHFGADRGHPWRGRGARIPRLQDVLTADTGTRAIIEIKDATLEAASAVAAVVRAARADDRVCVGSFHSNVLLAMRQLAPGIVTSASLPEAWWTMVRSKVGWPWMPRRPFHAFQVPEFHGGRRVLTPAFVRQARREGVRIQVWVVDRPDDMRRLLDWGVDGIITDRPDVMVPACREYHGRTVSDAGEARSPAMRR